MLRALVGILLLAAWPAALASGEGEAASPTPVMKVIGLLEKLKTQSEDEGQAEAVAYDTFACFCKAQSEMKIEYINKAISTIKLLSAQIKKLSAEIVEINGDVTETNTKIESLEKEMAEASKQRDGEHHEYTLDRKDLAEAVRGAEEAIEMMKSSDHTGLLQTDTSAGTKLQELLSIVAKASDDRALAQLSVNQTARLTALMDVADSLGPEGQATGFQFHSGEIIENLMKVLKDFKNQKNDVESTEADSKHEYDMATNAQSNQLKAMKATNARNEAIIANKEDKKANSELNKAKNQANQESDQAFLDNLVVECENTAKAWDAQSKTRANELMALTEALEIIKGKVADMYGANKKLNLLSVQEGPHGAPHGHWEWVPEQVSFLQLNRPKHRRVHSSTAQKLLRYLQRQSLILKSPVLSTLALKMKADHFVKVRTMIKDLVAKLEADAEAEQTQKGWCDEEMGKATSKRDENIGAIEGDSAEITEAKATIDQLNVEINDFEKQIAELYKALNQATKIRTEEETENKKTIDDATAGLGAVNAAVKVLKDFYEESLVQVGSSVRTGEPIEGAPDTGLKGADFKGNQEQSKGIIGLMEVIISDFEGSISETTDAEKEATDEYKTFKSESDDTIKDKKSQMRGKKDDVKTTKSDLMDYQDNLKEHKGLKTEALSELEKLTPACVGTGVSYQERVARREQEIQSLKNAYKILDEMSA